MQIKQLILNPQVEQALGVIVDTALKNHLLGGLNVQAAYEVIKNSIRLFESPEQQEEVKSQPATTEGVSVDVKAEA